MLKNLGINLDFILLASAVLLTFFGITVLFDLHGASSFALRQSIWLFLGVLVFILSSNIDFSFLKNGRFLLLLFSLTVISLLAVLFLSHAVKGAQSRFYIFGFAIQPADPAQLVLVAILAKYFSRRHMQIAHIKHILISGIYALILFFLVAAQPDLGSALMLASIWFFVVLLSGISKKHLFALFAIAALLAFSAWNFALQDYQKKRILVFLDPLTDLQGSGYNAYQSIVAVGSGGLLGKGIGFGTQSKLHFLPEYQTDFIFAAFAEEWGLLGALLLLTLFAILVFRIVQLGARAKDNFVRLFSIGLAAMLITHFSINVGMNIGLLPITGITLPFVSYGGSHLITEFLALGILSSFTRDYKA